MYRTITPHTPCRVVVIANAEQFSITATDVLLKTLERQIETVFLFTVNDLAKFSAAVRSRCHVYRVRQVREAALVRHLEQVCRQGGISYDLAALLVVAQVSKGLCGIAVGMLDEIARDGDVTVRAARIKLGVAFGSVILQCWEAILAGLREEALSRFEAIGSDDATRLVAMQAFLLELRLRHEFGTRIYAINPALDELSDADWERILGAWERFAGDHESAGDLIRQVTEFWAAIRRDTPGRIGFLRTWQFMTRCRPPEPLEESRSAVLV